MEVGAWRRPRRWMEVYSMALAELASRCREPGASEDLKDFLAWLEKVEPPNRSAYRCSVTPPFRDDEWQRLHRALAKERQSLSEITHRLLHDEKVTAATVAIPEGAKRRPIEISRYYHERVIKGLPWGVRGTSVRLAILNWVKEVEAKAD